MGVVYKANHQGLKRLVALKMIRSGGQARADLVARFRTEAEAVARLRHPNILQIYDIGEADGQPFVALELLEGGSLGDRLASTPQPARQSAELVMLLARAVHVAHQAGIVHRDLKPSNVLYAFDGVPKITDFGLAKRIDSDDGHTESGQIMGSPSYMAPEQAKGHSRNVGPAADVYALGAILYEMLTGRPPFKGETPIETIRQVVDDDPVAPSQAGTARAARPRDHQPQVPPQRPRPALPVGRSTCRRPVSASSRTGDPGPPDAVLGARRQMVAPPHARRRLAGSGHGGICGP